MNMPDDPNLRVELIVYNINAIVSVQEALENNGYEVLDIYYEDTEDTEL